MPNETSPVIYEQDGAVVTVTLNRPQKMNNRGAARFAEKRYDPVTD